MALPLPASCRDMQVTSLIILRILRVEGTNVFVYRYSFYLFFTLIFCSWDVNSIKCRKYTFLEE